MNTQNHRAHCPPVNLKKIIYFKKFHNLINAHDFEYKLNKDLLEAEDICLTFDDSLMSQIDVAVPILENYQIKAYFFIYSSPFSGEPDMLEIYRHFRSTKFSSIENFYEEFFTTAKDNNLKYFQSGLKSFEAEGYLHARTFYSTEDRFFRFLRDKVFDPEEYAEIMQQLFKQFEYNSESHMKSLWMSELDLKTLHDCGHVIGLHSCSHPTRIDLLDKSIQEDEYRRNINHLRGLKIDPVIAMSHPCGVYSSETLQILESLEIRIGFRSGFNITDIKSSLEVPRVDHTYYSETT
jgi:peptidoglycan/xylan/chitin deacetylase (PgdA/CDA1 family)